MSNKINQIKEDIANYELLKSRLKDIQSARESDLSFVFISTKNKDNENINVPIPRNLVEKFIDEIEKNFVDELIAKEEDLEKRILDDRSIE